MSKPMMIDIPHSLGREEAKRRLKSRIGELAGHIPGGAADVRHGWPTEDRMELSVDALGQSVSTVLDVEDKIIRLQLKLPAMLSFMSGAIEKAIRKGGAAVLLEDKSKG
ncbi:MAG TPA: polyhydroxyalkanoic acid system family protein [Sphingomonadaceae bacterium]|nr:polyhydroxyalkanoic acid system family protein [Sphingomonadaceae bacterium]